MRKLSLTKTVSTALLLSMLVPYQKAQAHQDGCHRWHSCPSDTGSYVCGDLGYRSGCPTPARPSVSNSSAESAYNQYMQIGYNAIERKDYQTALINFKRAFNQRPGDSYAIDAIHTVESYIQQKKRKRAKRVDD